MIKFTFSSHGSSQALWSKVDGNFPNGLKVHFTLLCVCLLKAQDPATEVKTPMKWQIYLHVNLLKFGKSSVFMQSVHLSCWSSHPLLPVTPSGSIPHHLKHRTPGSPSFLGTDSLRALKQEPTLPHTFMYPPYLLLSELSIY